MHDLNWCWAELRHFDERLGDFHVRVGLLRQHVAEVRGGWDDSAARQVFQKFLDPFRQATEHMEEKLRGQSQLLHESAAALGKAIDLDHAIVALSDRARQGRQRIHGDIREVDARVDHSIQDSNDSEHLCQEAWAALQHAGFPPSVF